MIAIKERQHPTSRKQVKHYLLVKCRRLTQNNSKRSIANNWHGSFCFWKSRIRVVGQVCWGSLKRFQEDQVACKVDLGRGAG